MRLFALAAAGVMLASATADSQVPIAVAVMTRTGFLVPFVQINGNAITSLIEPIGDSAFSLARQARDLERSPWTLRTVVDGATTEVMVSGRQKIDLGYEFYEGWKTTFKGKPWPANYVPIPKIGLATQGVVPEVPEDLVTHPDVDSQPVRALISRLAHARETAFLKTDLDYVAHKFSPEQRREKVVRLRKLWRHRSNGADTYYFEATKRYEYSELLLTGWVVVAGGRITPRVITLQPSDDEYKTGVHRQVLGIIPLRQRDLWVMESHYYEGERRSIREWPSGTCTLNPNNDDCD